MAKAPPPALQTALQNWQQRAVYYNALGIPQSQWYDIATTDLQKVANTGAAPMATSDVNAAMAAQLAGHSLIANPQPHHHRSIFGEIAHVVGSIPSDIQNLTTGFLPGAAHFLTHLPQEVAQTGEYLAHTGDTEWLLAHGYADPKGSFLHHFAADLENMAKAPLLSFIPGVWDVGELMTPQGREYLASHPVSTTLDVVPAGKIAGMGTRTVLRAAGRTAEEGTALEAMAAGKPIHAAGRKVYAVSAKLSPEKTAARAAAFNEALHWAGLHRRERGVSRAVSETTRWATDQARRQLAAVDKGILSMDDKEAAKFFNTVSVDFDQAAAPEHEALAANARMATRQLIDNGKTIFDKTKGKDGLLTFRWGKAGLEGRAPLAFSASEEMKRYVRHRDTAWANAPKAAAARDRAVTLLNRQDTNIADLRRRLAEAEAHPRLQMHRQRLAAAETHPRLQRIRQRLVEAHAAGVPVRGIERDLADATERLTGPPRRDLARAVNYRTRVLRRELATAEARRSVTAARVAKYEMRRRSLVQRAWTNRGKMVEEMMRIGGPPSGHARAERDIKAAVTEHRVGQYQKEAQALEATRPFIPPETFNQYREHILSSLSADLYEIDRGTTFDEVQRAMVDPAKRLGNPQAEKYARDQFEAIRTDIVKNVLDLFARGMEPVWVKHVEPGREAAIAATTVNLLPDRVPDMTQFNKKVLNFAPRVHNVALGMSAAAIDLWKAQGSRILLEQFVLPHAETVASQKADFLKLSEMDDKLGRRPRTRSIQGHAQALLNETWEGIQPEHWGLSDWGQTGRFSKDDQLLIPKSLASNLKRLAPISRDSGTHQIPLLGKYDKALHVFRVSVLTGPRHLVHVGVGGLGFLMIREPGGLLQVRNAYRIWQEVKAGQHQQTWARLVKHQRNPTDAVLEVAVGKQYASWWRQGWEKTGGNLIEAAGRLEDTLTDIYRVSAGLSAAKSGVDFEQVVARANKVMVDMDDMAPWERTIVKHIFPFYGYTKHLFRYLLTLPVDHPYRVAILTRFATQEQQDWNTGLPPKFMLTMFLGHPDAQGNIKTIDFRNVDPFRSFSNDFTMLGFFQSLSPFLSAPLAMRGFNVLTATGPLYPSLQLNPTTGTLQAAPPSGRTQLFAGAEQFIPELGALDHFIGITDQMRTLKRSGNNAAYQSLLYSQLNLPGVFAPPVTVNLPYVQERYEMDRYKLASQAVTAYTEGKAPADTLRSFSYIPYQGQYYTPDEFINYWEQIKQAYAQTAPGIDPRALISTPIRRTSQNPLELLQAQGGYIPAAVSNVP